LQNAFYVWQRGIITWSATYCRKIATSKSNFEAKEINAKELTPAISLSDADQKVFLVALCQLLSNFAACGSEVSLLLWSESFGCDKFRDFFAACQASGNRAATAAVISAIYNSIKNSPSHEEDGQGCMTLYSSRPLLSQILLCALPQNVTISSDGELTSISSVDVQDPVLEWLHLLVFHWIQLGKVAQVFQTVRPRAEGESVWGCDSDSHIGENKSNSSANDSESSPHINNRPPSLHLTHEQVKPCQ
jgi:hypothetical protein